MDPLTGLQPVDELTISDHIPSAGEVGSVLIEVLPQLPGQVVQIAGDLPDMLLPRRDERELEP